ncbi:hypothetical protein AYI69_g10385 [Smittium culicis]|uniref:DUF7137 domain-containing protein n=1 Tax=Smittium culicis TaxID=133412 RepID=A0A1R1X628_9FUNG|nr:hypothetical protein AYI69_g10385 [Smittium culicis]
MRLYIYLLLFYINGVFSQSEGDRIQPPQAQILNSGSKQEPNSASKPPSVAQSNPTQSNNSGENQPRNNPGQQSGDSIPVNKNDSNNSSDNKNSIALQPKQSSKNDGGSNQSNPDISVTRQSGDVGRSGNGSNVQTQQNGKDSPSKTVQQNSKSSILSSSTSMYSNPGDGSKNVDISGDKDSNGDGNDDEESHKSDDGWIGGGNDSEEDDDSPGVGFPAVVKIIQPPKSVPTPLFEIGTVINLEWEYSKELDTVPKKITIAVQIPRELSSTTESQKPIIIYDIAANISGSIKNYSWDTSKQLKNGSYYNQTNDGVPRDYNPNTAKRPNTFLALNVFIVAFSVLFFQISFFV